MSEPPLRFYFDFISPYAFLAWTQIRAIAKRHDRVLEPIPVLFAALLNAHGTKGPAEIPAKRRYLFKDIARKAHRLGIENVTPPPAHPFNPLHALRVAAIAPPGDEQERVIDTLFMAAWTQHKAIDSIEAVASLVGESSWIASAQTQEAKDRVRAQTDAAIKEGVFGVPTVIVSSELFWGTDSLDDLDAFLAGRLPTFSDDAWASLPAAATRKFSP